MDVAMSYVVTWSDQSHTNTALPYLPVNNLHLHFEACPILSLNPLHTSSPPLYLWSQPKSNSQPRWFPFTQTQTPYHVMSDVCRTPIIHLDDHILQEKLLGQSQWKDYSGPMGPPPLQHNYGYDGLESEDGKMGGLGGWQQHRQSYERYSRANTHSLPRGSHQPPPPSSRAPSYPMGYSSFDRRERGGHVSSRPGPGHDGFPPPDHYFMPSQRKMYSGESIRVYVDYNKWSQTSVELELPTGWALENIYYFVASSLQHVDQWYLLTQWRHAVDTGLTVVSAN